MSRTLFDGLIVVGILATLGLHWTIVRDTSRPGLEFLPEMVRSPAYAAFSENPHFSDGKTLRAPVAGTIPKGHRPLHYEATPEEAIRAGRELFNPLPDDPSVIDQGQTVYRNFCATCHGNGGLGDGPVVRRGVPAPPSLLEEHARVLPEGQLFHILTYGQGNMPAYASQLSQEERWQVTRYVRSLQRSTQTR